jgi:hypothetical protein
MIFCVLKISGGGDAGIDGAFFVTGFATCFGMGFATGLGAGGGVTRLGLLEMGGFVGIGARPAGVVVEAATRAKASAIVGIGPDASGAAAPAGARVVL